MTRPLNGVPSGAIEWCATKAPLWTAPVKKSPDTECEVGADVWERERRAAGDNSSPTATAASGAQQTSVPRGIKLLAGRLAPIHVLRPNVSLLDLNSIDGIRERKRRASKTEPIKCEHYVFSGIFVRGDSGFVYHEDDASLKLLILNKYREAALPVEFTICGEPSPPASIRPDTVRNGSAAAESRLNLSEAERGPSRILNAYPCGDSITRRASHTGRQNKTSRRRADVSAKSAASPALSIPAAHLYLLFNKIPPSPSPPFAARPSKN
ncbi:unnamed protein product, partial [Iphiclides podalirius]